MSKDKVCEVANYLSIEHRANKAGLHIEPCQNFYQVFPHPLPPGSPAALYYSKDLLIITAFVSGFESALDRRV